MRLAYRLMPLTLFGAASSMALAADYVITQIGNLPGTEANVATAINNNGLVVGYGNGVGFAQGWTWNGPGTFTPMPHGNGLITSTFNLDVNDNGEIAGRSYHNGKFWAFKYKAGPGYTFKTGVENSTATAFGINIHGDLVGYSVGNTALNATQWKNGQPGEHLPFYSAGEHSVANSINDAGKSTGYSTVNGVKRAIIYYAAGTTLDVHGDLPMGVERSEGNDVTALGHTIGGYWMPGQLEKSYYTRGVGVHLIDLPTGMTMSHMEAMNRYGSGVGYARIGNSFQNRAAIWSDETGIRDLNSLIDPNSGWTLLEANDINDSGWIVGVGEFMGVRTTFLATPVPEPSSILFISIGVIGLLRRKQSK